MRRPARPSGDGTIRERAFHRWLAENLPAGRSGLLELGDDAAALRPPRGTVAVVSTDALVEGSHFLPDSRP
ncbi:MAG TPA: thiamine-phosphate kinase, partial [Thermoplasmata archaeon]|nr:thiamine-phosphate kinase [Thermoplasmata archaeon]